MTKQTKKRNQPKPRGYRPENYVGLYIHLSGKWAIAITLLLLIKLIPEWWNYLQKILPILFK